MNRASCLVIIESPYAGDIAANVAYARKCLRNSLFRGESPIASHLLYTQPEVLDDLIPEQRTLGINAGLSWAHVADLVVFCVDLGWSPGMLAARAYCEEHGIPHTLRSLEG